MAAGTRANLADNPAAAEAAFRAALALQQKALGEDNPNTATRGDDAGAATLRRGALRRGGGAVRPAPNGWRRARPTRSRARGCCTTAALDALNHGETEAALALLQQAADAYTRAGPARCACASAAVGAGGSAFARPGASLVAEPGPADRPGGAGGAARADRGAAQPRRCCCSDDGQARREPTSCSPARPASPRPTGWRGRSWRRGCTAPAAMTAAGAGDRAVALDDLAPRSRRFRPCAAADRSRWPTPTCCARRRTGAQPGTGAARRCRLCQRAVRGAGGAEGRHDAGADGTLPRRLRRRRGGGRRDAPPDAAGRDVRRRAAGAGQHHQPADRPGHRAAGGERARPAGGARRSAAARTPRAALAALYRQRDELRRRARRVPRRRRWRPRRSTSRSRARRPRCADADAALQAASPNLRPVGAGGGAGRRRARGAASGRGVRRDHAGRTRRLGVRCCAAASITARSRRSATRTSPSWSRQVRAGIELTGAGCRRSTSPTRSAVRRDAGAGGRGAEGREVAGRRADRPAAVAAVRGAADRPGRRRRIWPRRRG